MASMRLPFWYRLFSPSRPCTSREAVMVYKRGSIVEECGCLSFRVTLSPSSEHTCPSFLVPQTTEPNSLGTRKTGSDHQVIVGQGNHWTWGGGGGGCWYCLDVHADGSSGMECCKAHCNDKWEINLQRFLKDYMLRRQDWVGFGETKTTQWASSADNREVRKM